MRRIVLKVWLRAVSCVAAVMVCGYENRLPAQASVRSIYDEKRVPLLTAPMMLNGKGGWTSVPAVPG